MKKIVGIGIVLALCGGVQAGVVAYWPFGTNGLNDVSGNGHALVNENVAVAGNAYFNGTNAFLKTAASLDLTGCQKVTVECWMCPQDQIDPFGVIFVSDPPASAPGGFVFYAQKEAKCLQAQFRAKADYWDISARNDLLTEGAWHHVALVMDPSRSWSDKSQLYIDGVKVTAYQSAQTFTGTSFLDQFFFLGGGASYGLANGNHFRGWIDDVRISDEALTPDQFLKFPTPGVNMSPENPTFAHWTFGVAGGTDVTGNGFDFTVQNGAVTYRNGYATFSGGGGLGFPQAFPANCFTKSGLTYEFFFRTTSTNGAPAIMLENSGAYYSYPGCAHVRLDLGTRQVYPSLRTDKGYITRLSHPEDGRDIPANDGNWHHVAVVYNPVRAGSEYLMCAYFDGKLLEANSDASPALTTLNGSSSFFIGARAWRDFGFSGDIDDVRVMPWALTPEEFLRAPTTTDQPLAAYDFTSAEPLRDQTGHGNDLENGGGVAFGSGYAQFHDAGTANGCYLRTLNALPLAPYRQLTVECRFQYPDANDFGVLFATENCDSKTPGSFVLYKYLNCLWAQCGGATGWQQDGTTTASAYADNAWHHLAYTVDLGNAGPDACKVYLDGREQVNNGNNNVSASAFTDVKFCIGGGLNYGSTQPHSFNGCISHLCVTPMVLSTNEFRLAVQPAPTGVIAYWKFGVGLAEDDSGNNHRLSVRGAQSIAGAARVGPGAWLETVEPLDLSPYEAVTLECFARCSAAPTEGGHLLSTTNEVAAGTFRVTLDGAGEALRADYSSAVGYVNASTSPLGAFADGEWHHLALVLDRRSRCADAARFYVDGVRATPERWSSADGAFASRIFKIGSDVVLAADEAGFEVDVDDVKITAAALDPASFMTPDLRSEAKNTILILR